MGDNYIRLENYEMLKALYDFKATFAKTLSFQEDDHFILHQTNMKHRNWWQVINANGQLGYIPSNYIATVKVQPQFMINFLDNCISKLSNNDDKSGAINTDTQDLLQRLVEKRRQAEISRKPKKQAPIPPVSPSKETSSEPQNRPEEDAKPSNASLLTTDPIEPKVQNNRRGSSNGNSVKHLPKQTSSETLVAGNADPIEPKLQNNRRGSTNENSSKHLPRQTSSETAQRTQPAAEDTRKSPSHSNIRQSPNSSPVKSNSSSSLEIDSRAAYHLLDEVRRNTQLSYDMSKVAVQVVVSGLQQLLPSTMSRYFDAVLLQLQTPIPISKFRIEETYDANRLKIIFTELTSCKEDSQQRSWMLYEDEAIIVEYIKELTSILTNADANVTRHALRQDQYNGVSNLILYYQMEARWTIRQLLLQSFGVMCSLDPVALTIMLNSVLPMELARDMRSNPRNVAKLNYSSLLLTMIFSMGEPMPVTHLEHLGPDFISFLLELIENPPDTDLEDQIPDLFLNLILSYNLQFTSSENIVLKAFREITIAKTFTQKILLLLNREEDPVRIFDHEPAPPHSVLKLFIDLFGNVYTAMLFYTNDIKALIDIVLRQLFDIPPGDKRRLYLELCRRFLRTTEYDEHLHRCEDLLKCFTRIFCEESPESHEDQKLVREISNEFPKLFQM